jgi:hypothetical protein
MTIYDYTVGPPFPTNTLNQDDKIVLYLANPNDNGAVWNVTPAQTNGGVQTLSYLCLVL